MNPSIFLADDFVAILGVGIPIVALMIPIVALLTRHQRQMAEIIHKRSPDSPGTEQEIQALRYEVHELKQLVQQQVIAVDALTGARPPKSSELVNQDGTN